MISLQIIIIHIVFILWFMAGYSYGKYKTNLDHLKQKFNLKSEIMKTQEEKQDKKALISFLIILTLIISALVLFGCNKKQSIDPIPAPPPPVTAPSCLNQDTSFLNKTWIPNDTLHANISFQSNYQFIQQGIVYGVWSKYGCDSVKVVHNPGTFYFGLTSITPDTLILFNPLYGNLKYHL